jgi:phosphoribosylglycinamide formyltransferase-1
MDKTKIAVLVSGGGTNLQALLDAEAAGTLHSGHIALVVSNVPGAYALERAKKAGVEALTLTRADCGGQEGFEAALLSALESRGIELIILAGFLSILSEAFVRRYDERILNVHPSLIPSFCGKGFYGLKVHEAALARGVKYTGASVHFVNEIPDGGRILLQKPVPVLPGDTPEILQRRVMEQAEWVILPRAAEKVCAEIIGADTKRKAEEGKMKKLADILRNNSYPGRGIVVGKNVVYYFIMGRSENSRNRIFSPTEDGIRTEAFDPSKVKDPSLIIYNPVRKLGDSLVVTNGDQTDTVVEMGCFRKALMTREYEPDAPNFTPRISAIVNKDGSFEMSILKHLNGTCLREFFAYEGCSEGVGYFISTYQGDGSPLPSFAGEPIEVELCGAEEVWDALNADNKVSLYANVGGEVKIFNKWVK